MNNSFFSFYKKSTLVTLVLFILGWIVFRFLLKDFYHPFFPFLLLFFYLLSLTIQYFLYKIIKMSMLNFSTRFMAFTMSKMLVLLVLALVYILLNKEDAIAFIVVFFLLYVIYTAVEIHDIMKHTEKK
ncbi:MAG: hypothetical protein A2W90_07020 [Bacteroidetes bacterium GWF2_42_66]|nr:MAG: hypothetical protein A2W92_01640 [Bacteroidetes bacterium GWA2_42_15]OFY02894.1 MAG: hypothetical protein A2W89_24425 [Bacteroidetes bacterium GWE2_42_39]OFY44549.1 MAG: hypothetical protein A2W90_07020 [Bacteroidetes bacterium GWF2_42_66]HBL74893.1 hypothetical protein [Prolixibacteraceae bacterium]HCR91742.1 hypothetical protein [Prolixibacteraceae bacterium]